MAPSVVDFVAELGLILVIKLGHFFKASWGLCDKSGLSEDWKDVVEIVFAGVVFNIGYQLLTWDSGKRVADSVCFRQLIKV